MRDPYSTTGPPLPYLRWGLIAGALGAALIALYFLVVDAFAGRPLATPNALGATLFLGEPFDLDRSVRPLFVLGYTAVHGGVFVGLAWIVAAIAFGRPTRPPGALPTGGVLAVLFFVTTALLGLGFRLQSGVSLSGELGIAHVAIANALAAVGMGAVLGHALSTRWQPPGRKVEPTDGSRRRETDPKSIDTRQLQSPPAGRLDHGRS